VQAAAVHAIDPADRRAKTVRPVLAALREDADARPRGISARVARRVFDRLVTYAIEDEKDFNVRELIETGEALGRNLRGERTPQAAFRSSCALAAILIIFDQSK
jgi:hypothetical protein